jgi:hypothetical protein
VLLDAKGYSAAPEPSVEKRSIVFTREGAKVDTGYARAEPIL